MTWTIYFLAGKQAFPYNTPFFMRTSNFGAEAERSYFCFCDLRLKTFLRR